MNKNTKRCFILVLQVIYLNIRTRVYYMLLVVFILLDDNNICAFILDHYVNISIYAYIVVIIVVKLRDALQNPKRIFIYFQICNTMS